MSADRPPVGAEISLPCADAFLPLPSRSTHSAPPRREPESLILVAPERPSWPTEQFTCPSGTPHPAEFASRVSLFARRARSSTIRPPIRRVAAAVRVLRCLTAHPWLP